MRESLLILTIHLFVLISCNNNKSLEDSQEPKRLGTAERIRPNLGYRSAPRHEPNRRHERARGRRQGVGKTATGISSFRDRSSFQILKRNVQPKIPLIFIRVARSGAFQTPWSTGPDMPTAHAWSTAQVPSGNAHVPGGFDAPDQSNSTHRLPVPLSS